jgi:hypothetical protein
MIPIGKAELRSLFQWRGKRRRKRNHELDTVKRIGSMVD